MCTTVSGVVAKRVFEIAFSPAGSRSEMAGGRVFCNDIIRGLLRRSPDLDLIRVQDVIEIAGPDDEKLLAWATPLVAVEEPPARSLRDQRLNWKLW